MARANQTAKGKRPAKKPAPPPAKKAKTASGAAKKIAAPAAKSKVAAKSKKEVAPSKAASKAAAKKAAPAAKKAAPAAKAPKAAAKPVVKNPTPAKEETKMITIIKKGSVPVDAECPRANDCHVYEDSTKAWAATLNQTDIGNNNNKYYII